MSIVRSSPSPLPDPVLCSKRLTLSYLLSEKVIRKWLGGTAVQSRPPLTIVLGKDLRQNVLYAPLEKQEGSTNEVLGSQPVLLFMIYHLARRSQFCLPFPLPEISQETG